MRIGVPRETKNHEYRVGLVPSSVLELTQRGHEVWVERGAGLGAGIQDEDFEAASARVVATAREVFEGAEMIVKVKEPLPAERAMLRPGGLARLWRDPRMVSLAVTVALFLLMFQRTFDATFFSVEAGWTCELTASCDVSGCVMAFQNSTGPKIFWSV